MPTPITTSARTDSCGKCGAKLTHITSVQQIEDDEPPNIAPYSCPKCGHVGTLAAQLGRRIVAVETKLYTSPLGR